MRGQKWSLSAYPWTQQGLQLCSIAIHIARQWRMVATIFFLVTLHILYSRSWGIWKNELLLTAYPAATVTLPRVNDIYIMWSNPFKGKEIPTLHQKGNSSILHFPIFVDGLTSSPLHSLSPFFLNAASIFFLPVKGFLILMPTTYFRWSRSVKPDLSSWGGVGSQVSTQEITWTRVTFFS